jgi:hypothetical protein
VQVDPKCTEIWGGMGVGLTVALDKTSEEQPHIQGMEVQRWVTRREPKMSWQLYFLVWMADTSRKQLAYILGKLRHWSWDTTSKGFNHWLGWKRKGQGEVTEPRGWRKGVWASILPLCPAVAPCGQSHQEARGARGAQSRRTPEGGPGHRRRGRRRQAQWVWAVSLVLLLNAFHSTGTWRVWLPAWPQLWGALFSFA